MSDVASKQSRVESVWKAAKTTAMFVSFPVRWYIRKDRLAYIAQTQKEISENRMYLSDSCFEELSSQVALAQSNLKMACRAIRKSSWPAVLSRISSLRAVAGAATTHNIKRALSRDLLSTVDSSTRDRILQNASSQYKVRPQNNALFAGVAAHRKQYGLAAMAAVQGGANSFRAGAHNANIDRIYYNYLFNVKFELDINRVPSDVGGYIRFSERVLCAAQAGIVDVVPTDAARARFALVANLSQSSIKPAVSGDKYAMAAINEFVTLFGEFIWSPAQAIAYLDRLKGSGATCSYLATRDRIEFKVNADTSFYFL